MQVGSDAHGCRGRSQRRADSRGLRVLLERTQLSGWAQDALATRAALRRCLGPREHRERCPARIESGPGAWVPCGGCATGASRSATIPPRQRTRKDGGSHGGVCRPVRPRNAAAAHHPRGSAASRRSPLPRNGVAARSCSSPGTPGSQEKSWPIETFFHKIVMMRNRLRTLEQQVNGMDVARGRQGEAAELHQRLLRLAHELQRALRRRGRSVQGRRRGVRPQRQTRLRTRSSVVAAFRERQVADVEVAGACRLAARESNARTLPQRSRPRRTPSSTHRPALAGNP